MKLLLDENLSRRLVPFLQREFPGSTQVALLGLERMPDRAIWEFAKDNGFVIVTNDTDFEALSVLFGAPPHVIRLRGGNASRATVLELLTSNAVTLREAVDVEKRAVVEILARPVR